MFGVTQGAAQFASVGCWVAKDRNNQLMATAARAWQNHILYERLNDALTEASGTHE